MWTRAVERCDYGSGLGQGSKEEWTRAVEICIGQWVSGSGL